MQLCRVLRSTLLLIFFAPAITGFGQDIVFSEDFEIPPQLRWKQTVVKGNLAFDTFQFTSGYYLPSPPIQGQFALFDVYRSGKREGSNGDGSTEFTFLKSPDIPVRTGTRVHLAFDYFLIRLRTPTFRLDASPDNGKTWQPVWADSSGTVLTRHTDVRLDPLFPASHNLQFRFSWQTSDTFVHQGYVLLDNVVLYYKRPDDVAVDLSAIQSGICSNDSLSYSVQISNQGTLPANNVEVRTVIKNGPSVVADFRDTISHLNSGDTAELKKIFKPKQTGNFTFSSFITKKDSVPANDTSVLMIPVGSQPSNATTYDGSRCGKGPVWLGASSSDTIFWFTKTGKIRGSGATFKTDSLTATDTFQAKSGVIFKQEISSFQGPYRFSNQTDGGSYVELIANHEIRITGIYQHFAQSGDSANSKIYVHRGALSGTERQNTLWTLHQSQKIKTSSWGNYTFIPFTPIYLNPGDTLSLYISFEGNVEFTFKKTEYAHSNDLISIRCPSVNNKSFSQGGVLYTPYSWDGKIAFETYCLSSSSPAIAHISPKPRGSSIQAGVNFPGIPKEGTFSIPDEATIRDSVRYLIYPPTGKTFNNFPDKWSVTGWEIRDENNQDVTSKLKVSVAKSGFVYLLIAPDSIWLNKKLMIAATLKDHSMNCDTFLQRWFRWSAPPKPDFKIGAACVNAPVTFTDISAGGKSVFWKFDDGLTDTSRITEHTFTKTKTYNVTLISQNLYGLKDSIKKSITVHLFPGSSIRAVHSCLGIPAEIQNASTNAGVTQSYYVWLFGSDTIFKSDVPSSFPYKFSTAGIHQVKLVSNNHGCIDSATKNIFQFENPNASFLHFGTCQFDSFHIQNTSTIANSDKLGFRWLIDNKTFSTLQNPNGIHQESGPHKISLIVTSEFNCADTAFSNITILPSVKAAFQVGLACKNDSTRFTNFSINPSSTSVTYFWDFGDGKLSSKFSPHHYFDKLGDQRVTLTAVCNNGCKTSFDTNVIVRVHPDAHFQVDDVCAGETVSFVNQSKLENKILQYLWYFGDGDSSVLHSPTHIYQTNEASTYVVRLKVYTADEQCTDEFADAIEVHEIPSCDFGYIRNINDSLTYQFYARDSSIINYTWAFGGGGMSSEERPVHTFQDTNSYVITLFAANKYGCRCTADIQITPGSSGIEKFSNSFISVYPNPTKGKFFIRTLIPLKIESVLLFNATGQRLTAEISNINDTVIEIHIPDPYKNSGFVLAEIKTTAGVFHYRIVVQSP